MRVTKRNYKSPFGGGNTQEPLAAAAAADNGPWMGVLS